MKHIFKRTLASLLVAIMILTVAPMSTLFASAETLYQIIEFGSYPQTKVTDSSLISKLDAQSKTWKSYGYYSGTGSWSDGKMTASDYMQYADFSYKSDKYRAVKFSSYRPLYTGYKLDNDTSHTYQDDNGYEPNTVYYFKYETLQWRVLDADTGLILCDSIIDSQAYNNYVYRANSQYWGDSGQNHYASDYAHSSIHDWLNKDFYNTAFTGSQQSKIIEKELENKSTNSSQYDSENTHDKVFLLSYWDVLNTQYGFNSSYSAYDKARMAKATDYAQCQGCWVYRNSGSTYDGNSWWQLRSTSGSNGTRDVGHDGDVYSYCVVSYTGGGIRPALYLSNLQSDISEPDITGTLENEGVVSDYVYNDEYFSRDADIYYHDTALISLHFAIAAMVPEGDVDGKVLGKTEELNYAAKFPQAGVDFLEKLKYDFVLPYGYNKRPETNSIACIIGYKNINETDETIIALGIRGGGYEWEWGGNFNVGTGTVHEGFDMAKEQVLENLKDFIMLFKPEFNHNVKIWITGFSRAAATANLVAAELDNPTEYVGYNFYRKNIYAYTFETPMNTRATDAKAGLYNNIFNIINPIDAVTKLAPAAWGYRRYGTDCYLPSQETTGKDYKSLRSEMEKQYTKISGKTYEESFTFYELKSTKEISKTLVGGVFGKEVDFFKTNQSIGQGAFWDGFLDIIAGEVLQSQNYYKNKYQNALQKIIPTFLIPGAFHLSVGYNDDIGLEEWGHDISTYAKENISQLVLHPNEFLDEIRRITMSYLLPSISMGNPALGGVTAGELENLLRELDNLALGTVSHPNYIYSLVKFIGTDNGNNDVPFCMIPHLPALEVAWMKTVSEKETSYRFIGNSGYRMVKLNCPVDVQVYDSNGILRASIVGDEVQYIPDGYISTYTNENGEKCFCLPNDETYSIKITGTDTGTVSCTVSDYDLGQGKTLNSTNYYNIPITDGKVLTATLSELETNDNNSEIIIKDGNEVITPSETIENPTAQKFTVNVASTKSDSTIYGGGQFYKGDFAKVSVIAEDMTGFEGWYKDGRFVSAEMEYRFMVIENCSLVAIFKGGTSIFQVKSVKVSDISLTYKKTTTLKPEIVADDGVKYTVEYKSANPKVATVDEKGNVAAKGKGTATITVTVTDEYGNTVEDTCTVTVKLTFLQKIIMYVLFGWLWGY